MLRNCGRGSVVEGVNTHSTPAEVTRACVQGVWMVSEVQGGREHGEQLRYRGRSYTTIKRSWRHHGWDKKAGGV